MKKLILLIVLAYLSTSGIAQSYLGVSGGISASDIYVDAVRTSTEFQVNSLMGINYSYYPDDNKPGIKFLLNRLSYGFNEIYTDHTVRYTNTGWNFQFLNIMYLPIKKSRISLQMGPAISYFNNPKVMGDNSDSPLPKFTSEQLNNVMLDLEGGVGFSRQVSKFNLEAHSVFVFTASKVYKNLLGFANTMSIQVVISIQYAIN